MRHGVHRLADGGVHVRLELGERALLRSLADQLRPILAREAGDAALWARLYPPASADRETEESYRRLVDDALVSERLDALELFARTLDAGRETPEGWEATLDSDQAHGWLSATNDARLTLALVVGVTTEADWEAGPDLDDPTSAALWYLGWLEEELLAALSASL